MKINAKKDFERILQSFGTKVVHLRQDFRFQCPDINRFFEIDDGTKWSIPEFHCLGTEYVIRPEARLARVSSSASEDEGFGPRDLESVGTVVYVRGDVPVHADDRFCVVDWSRDKNRVASIKEIYQVKTTESYHGNRGEDTPYQRCFCDNYRYREVNTANRGEVSERELIRAKIEHDLVHVD